MDHMACATTTRDTILVIVTGLTARLIAKYDLTTNLAPPVPTLYFSDARASAPPWNVTRQYMQHGYGPIILW